MHIKYYDLKLKTCDSLGIEMNIDPVPNLVTSWCILGELKHAFVHRIWARIVSTGQEVILFKANWEKHELSMN